MGSVEKVFLVVSTKVESLKSGSAETMCLELLEPNSPPQPNAIHALHWMSVGDFEKLGEPAANRKVKVTIELLPKEQTTAPT